MPVVPVSLRRAFFAGSMLSVTAWGCVAGVDDASYGATTSAYSSATPDGGPPATPPETAPAEVEPDADAPSPLLVDAAEPEKCPDGMALVTGQACTRARQVCARWLESPELFSYARCGEYEPFAMCVGPRTYRSFCIDRLEYTPPGETLPATQVSWTKAKKTCEGMGKRLCTESEWQFACEGEGMLPYPYGFTRDAETCNADQPDLYRPDGSLRDARAPSGSHAACASPFGVMDMVGNVDEWTIRDDSPGNHRSSLRGGWWMAGRNRCRAATTAHDEIYAGPQTGFRCCASPE